MNSVDSSTLLGFSDSAGTESTTLPDFISTAAPARVMRCTDPEAPMLPGGFSIKRSFGHVLGACCSRWWQLKDFFIFTPIMGKIPNLTKIFFNWVEITKQCWILDVFLPNYCFHVLGKKQVFILWGKVLVLLLMEEILHHLGCIKP